MELTRTRLQPPGAAGEPRRDDARRAARRAGSRAGRGGRAGAGAGERARTASAPATRARRRGGGLSRREETERAFLALCIASPEEGAEALAEARRRRALLQRAAAARRRGTARRDLREPMAARRDGGGRSTDDPELKAPARGADRRGGPRDRRDPAMLEVQRLQLELARLERQIQQARGQRGRRRQRAAPAAGEVKREFDRAYAQVLEETGEVGAAPRRRGAAAARRGGAQPTPEHRDTESPPSCRKRSHLQGFCDAGHGTMEAWNANTSNGSSPRDCRWPRSAGAWGGTNRRWRTG